MSRFIACLMGLIILGVTNLAAAQNLLNGPQCVEYDTLRDCYLVGNMDDGAIVRISLQGEQTYFDNSLTNVMDLHIVGDTLYVVSKEGANAGLIGFDLQTGARVMHVTLPEMFSLMDVTSDASGYLYVSEHWSHLLYRVHIATQVGTLFVNDGLHMPGALHFDSPNNRLLVAKQHIEGGAAIRAVDLTSALVTIVVEEHLGGPTGLVEDADGNIYFSLFSGSIYKYDHDFSGPYELFTTGHTGGVIDIHYNEERCEMALVEYNTNRLVFVLDPDADPDGDSILHSSDNCPFYVNPEQDDTDADAVGDACDNCPETYNPDQADLNASGIGDVCEPGFTRPGTGVVVDIDDSLRVLFTQVTEAGVTTATRSAEGPASPYGYRLVPSTGLPYCDIHTDAPYAGSILIRFRYDPDDLSGPEDGLRIFHQVGSMSEGTIWEDCTYSHNLDAHEIWGEVTGLSNFILAEPGCPCDCHSDPQCDGATNVLDVVSAVNVAFRSGTPASDPGCAYEQTDVNCDGFTNVIDVVKFVNVAFRSGDPAVEFCDPCAP